jgi:hypothetical protein
MEPGRAILFAFDPLPKSLLNHWKNLQERSAGCRVFLRFLQAPLGSPGSLFLRRLEPMWIALFSIASAAAIGLSLAAVMVQANQEETPRG